MKKYYLLSICITFYLIANSQIPPISGLKDPKEKGTFGIDVEQDWFVDWWPNANFDRNYTQGTGFSYSHTDLGNSVLFFPFTLIDRICNGKKDQNVIPYTIAMGITAFTPRIIDSDVPIIGDRPFANAIFFSTIKNKRNNKREILNSTSLTYGLIGTNLAYSFQSFAHKHLIKGRPTDPSWEHQISNGGHFAFLFSHTATKAVLQKSIKPHSKIYKANVLSQDAKGLSEYARKLSQESMIMANDTVVAVKTADSLALLARRLSNASFTLSEIADSISIVTTNIVVLKNKNACIKWLEFTVGTKLDFGWYTGITALTNLKVGRISNSNLININSSLIVGNQNNNPKTKVFWEIYGFGSANPRLTPHNSLILGQPLVHSLYTLNEKEYNPFIVDFEYGLVVSRIKTSSNLIIPVSRVELVLSINHRTSEINNLKYNRWHNWGRVSLRFPIF